MTPKHLLLALALGAPLAALADGTVSGRAFSKETKQPLDYATVQLLDARTGKPLPIGTMTAEDGTFSIPNVADGEYIVRISSVGNVDNERPVKITGSNVDIGSISLAEDSKLLQEVVVEGVRSQMRFELDRKVFQVDANVVAAGQSASELLESIPSVEVDQDGEVSLRGNSSVTVWINGKESGLSADNRAQILEQIPGDTIERIEVITNPSAKYSPEGTAGIINIVLKSDRRAGYFGSAEIGGNSRGGANAGFNINYNSSKWDAYASVGARMRHNKGGSLSRRDYFGDNEGCFLNSDGSSRNHGDNLFLRAGATYHLTKKDDLYLNAFGMFGHRWGHSETDYRSNLPGQWSLDKQLSRNRSDNRGAHAELGYTRKWSDNHTLDVMAAYNHWGGPMRNYYEEDIFWPLAANNGAADSEANGDERTVRTQEQNIGVNSVEAKVDYTNVFSQYLKLEAGYNGNYSHESTPVSGERSEAYGQGAALPGLQPDPTLFNKFIYQNNITAFYFTLGGKAGNFSYSGGLRAEAWQVRTRSLDYADLTAPLQPGQDRKELAPLFRKDKFALFPSLYLSYALPHDNEVQLNYARRIRRPWGGMLNSFVDVSDPTAYRYGNPELEPQYSNSFELNWLKSWDQHMISFSGYLRTSDNMMSQLSYLWEGMMYNTSANAGREANSGCEIVSKNHLLKIVDLTTTVNLYNNHMSAWRARIAPPTDFDGELGELPANWGWVEGKKRNSFAWDVSCMASLRLPWQLGFQATGRYASKMLQAQGTRQGGWNVDAGLRKTFGKWSVSLSCRDIFDSRKFKNTIDGPDYTQHSERWRGGRRLQLTVKYSFGNMRAKQDRRQNSEPMDGSGYGEGMD